MDLKRKAERYMVAGYLAALAVAAIVIVGGGILMRNSFSESLGQSSVINLAGRQRMLSQRLSSTMLHLGAYMDPLMTEVLRGQLKNLSQEFGRVHDGLQSGNAEMGLSGRNSATIKGLFQAIDPSFQQIQATINRFFSVDEPGKKAMLTHPIIMAQILEPSEKFLILMDRIVLRYKIEAESLNLRLSRIYFGLTLIILAILAFVTIFVFWPMMRNLRHTNQTLSQTNDNLEWEITQRIRSEGERRQLITAIEHAEETIVITDTNGRIEYANPAFEHTTGYTSKDTRGNNMSLIKSGEHDKAHYRDMRETVLSGNVWRGQFINRHREGSLFTEQVSVSPVRDQDGKIVKFIAVKRDITHESKLEAQLMRVQKLESIGSLAGGIAHEFNNILTPILGYLELMQKDASADQRTLEYLGRVHKGALRARDLVAQILLFGQGGGGRLDTLHMDKIAKEVLSLVKASLPPNIKIDTDGIENVPPLNANQTDLHTMVMNLIVNAGQAMLEGGCLKVAVSTVWRSDERPEHPERGKRQYVCLEVTDSGCGMTQTVKDRIFDPFYTTKAVGEGTGLGLSMVFGIVEEHNGFIEVETNVGRGTTFRIFLPTSEMTTIAPSIPTLDHPATPSRNDSARILLVDDETEVLKLISTLLRRMGHKVVSLDNTREALAMWHMQSGDYDLAILDYLMPDMDGVALGERLRMVRENFPIILMTGRYDLVKLDGYPTSKPERMQGGLGGSKSNDEVQNGAINGILRKPFTYDDVEQLVNRVLDDSSGTQT